MPRVPKTKVCRDCGKRKPIASGFYISHKGHASSYCKPCDKARSVAAVRKREQRHRAMLTQIKLASGCVDCGYRDHPVALQFDHLPEFPKLFHISRGAGSVSDDALMAEVAKCQVVCANCHAIRTWDAEEGTARRKAAASRKNVRTTRTKKGK